MADYKKIRHTEIKGEKGTTWYVELWKDGFTGTSTEMTLGGEGFEITWNGQGSTRDRVFLGSECVLNLMVLEDNTGPSGVSADELLLYDILDSGFKKYFIRIYKNSTAGSDIWWYGYIQPSFDTIENAPYPYVSKITATDSYGYYEKQQFSTFSGEDEKVDNHNLVRIWLDFLHNMDLAPVNLIHNPYFRGNTDKGWVLQPNDSMTSSGLNISSDTGLRYTKSFLQTELIVGEKYELNIKVNSASGSLIVYDGYPGTLIDTISSAGLKTYTYTQSAAGGNPGLYFNTLTGSAFVGQIDWVSLNRVNNWPAKEVLPFPSDATNFMWTATDWHTSVNAENDATRYYICKGAFATNNSFPFEYKESDALKESLKIFNTVGFLAEGTYNFIQPNHYIDNTTGQNNFYKYNSETADASPISTTNLCEINQSTNVLLGGSSFTYEAPFKSVTTIFSSVGAFNIPKAVNITDFPGDPSSEDYTYGGQMVANQSYKLDWESYYRLETPSTNLDVESEDLSSYSYLNGKQSLHSYVTIKATSPGVADKYLTVSSSTNALEWSTTQKQVVLSRGNKRTPPTNSTYPSHFSTTFNNNTRIGGLDGGITTRYDSVSSGDFQLSGFLRFEADVPSLSSTSNLFIKVHTKADIVAYGRESDSSFKYSSGVSITNQNLVTEFSSSQGISLEVEETSSIVTNEQKYTATNTGSTATENYELDDVKVGITQANAIFSVTDVNNEAVVENWGRGSTINQNTITDLLVTEFLEMQQSPLQILQGSIQSANISPLDIVKYKLNTVDTNPSYYMFLGGTFKANSEIMDGEWFRIKGD